MADLSLRNTFNCFQNLWIFEVHRKCLLNWVPPSDASGANTCPRSARNWLIGMVSSPLISIKCKWKRTNCSSAHHLRASTVSNRSVRIAEAVPHQCRTAEIYCLWYMHDLRPNILVSIEQLENNSKHFLLLFWFCLQLIVNMWKWVIWQKRAKSMCHSIVWILEKTHRNLSSHCESLSWFPVISFAISFSWSAGRWKSMQFLLQCERMRRWWETKARSHVKLSCIRIWTLVVIYVDLSSKSTWITRGARSRARLMHHSIGKYSISIFWRENTFLGIVTVLAIIRISASNVLAISRHTCQSPIPDNVAHYRCSERTETNRFRE